MTAIWTRIKTEPVVAGYVVLALIDLLIIFGVDLDAEAVAAIIAAVNAVGLLIVRQVVIPTAKFTDPVVSAVANGVAPHAIVIAPLPESPAMPLEPEPLDRNFPI